MEVLLIWSSMIQFFFPKVYLKSLWWWWWAVGIIIWVTFIYYCLNMFQFNHLNLIWKFAVVEVVGSRDYIRRKIFWLLLEYIIHLNIPPPLTPHLPSKVGLIIKKNYEVQQLTRLKGTHCKIRKASLIITRNIFF